MMSPVQYDFFFKASMLGKKQCFRPTAQPSSTSCHSSIEQTVCMNVCIETLCIVCIYMFRCFTGCENISLWDNIVLDVKWRLHTITVTQDTKYPFLKVHNWLSEMEPTIWAREKLTWEIGTFPPNTAACRIFKISAAIVGTGGVNGFD